MKKSYLFQVALCCFAFLFSCKKDTVYLSGHIDVPGNFQYIVNGGSAHLSWEKPTGNFDSYTLQVSKMEDFSILDESSELPVGVNYIVLRKLDLGEPYFFRLRAWNQDPKNYSDWAVINSTTSKKNILLPISSADVAGGRVTVKWDFSKDLSPNHSLAVNRITLTPVMGLARQIFLQPQQIADKSIVIDSIVQDELYTVKIYNDKFERGSQTFATEANPVNGVWTLRPHSNLESVIDRAANGDRILLKPGAYDLSTKNLSIEAKSVSLEAFSEVVADRPKLYTNGFTLNGTGASISFVGLDISGARIDQYMRELPNLSDSRWNEWLVVVNGASTGFDSVSIRNSVVRNYWAGVFNLNDNNRPPHKTGNLVKIDNSMVYEIGGSLASNTININAGDLKKGVFTNSTYYKASRMFMLLDGERNPEVQLDMVFQNNTVDNSWGSGSFDFKGVKAPVKFLMKNNLFSNINCTGNFLPNFAYVANTFEKRLINCNFYNVLSKATIYGSNQSSMPVHSWELRHPNTVWTEVLPAFVRNDAQHDNPNSIKEYPVSIDPAYANPAGLDFSLPAASALRGIDGGAAIGDPRWW